MLNKEKFNFITWVIIIGVLFMLLALFRALDFRGSSVILVLDIVLPFENLMPVLYVEANILVRTFPEICIWSF